MIPDRAVRFPARTVLTVLLIVIAVWALLQVVLITRDVLTWILVALFLAIALAPAVDWLQRKGIRRRGYAVALTALAVAGAVALIGWLVIPQLVDQVNEFARKVPDYIDDLTKGRGRLGFLQTKYHIVERVREAVDTGGASKVFGLSGTAISITKSVLTMVAATITIIALTYFMLLEGPMWMERFYSLFSPPTQVRLRGICGSIAEIGRRLRDRQPLHQPDRRRDVTACALDHGRAVRARARVCSSGSSISSRSSERRSPPSSPRRSRSSERTASCRASSCIVFFVVYQQIENQLLQPLVYGRTVQLSPLVVLVAVLIGASLAGVLGALGAIPIAGAIQVVVVDVLAHRRGAAASAAKEGTATADT